MKLTAEQINHIETVLASGYDVEIRSLKKGITIASVGKKVVYKETAYDSSTDREKVSQ
jgi:uncharacterized protein with LGFP repeats